ncbi:MAG: hypothetical protein CME75_07885 [Halomonas sp.]|nr:hypothetical protein [Halomonas sp.]
MVHSFETLSIETRYDSDWEVTGEPVSLIVTDYMGKEVAHIIFSPEDAEQVAESLQQAADVAKRVCTGMGKDLGGDV